MWCAKKNEENEVIREHSSHMTRLLAIKPRLHIDPPQPMLHLQNKSKSKLQKQSRNELIQAENELLLQRMLEINSRPAKFSSLSDSSSQKSLNLSTRNQVMHKISEENQQILNRLQGIKPSYSFKKFDAEFKYKQYLKNKLSENSRRIPRVNSLRISPSLEYSKTLNSRPETGSSKYRPMTAVGNRDKSSYL